MDGMSIRWIDPHSQIRQSLCQLTRARAIEGGRRIPMEEKSARDTGLRGGVKPVERGITSMWRGSDEFIHLPPRLQSCKVGSPTVCELWLSHFLPLIAPLESMGDHERAPEVLRPEGRIKPSPAAGENGSSWKSDSGGLSSVLENCKVSASSVCTVHVTHSCLSRRRETSKRWGGWHPRSKNSLNHSATPFPRMMLGRKRGERSWNG